MIQWQFNPEQGEKAVSVVGTDDVVFYIDDINPEVVAKIVETYNVDNSIEKIGAYLKDETRCTEDESEFIIEQITSFITLTSSSENSSGAGKLNGTESVNPDLQKPANTDTPPFKDDSKGEGSTPPNQEPAKRRGRAPGTTNATSSKKSSGPDEVIKQLEEKILLIRLLSSSEVADIPTGLLKPSRDIMVEFQEKQEALVAEYMDRIQRM